MTRSPEIPSGYEIRRSGRRTVVLRQDLEHALDRLGFIEGTPRQPAEERLEGCSVDDQQVAKTVLEQGASAYVVKPFTLEVLRRSLLKVYGSPVT